LNSYELIDSGHLEKLERFGKVKVCRPCPVAVWEKGEQWNWDLCFVPKTRKWENPCEEWQIEFSNVQMHLKPTPFGHLGLFPEHFFALDFLKHLKLKKVLNLFAYTGFLSIALAQLGCEVTHVDSSKPVIEWAKKNAKSNGIETIRWIFEDCVKFCKKELKRGAQYDCILLDPPTFGRGSKNEVFKIEDDLMPLLKNLKSLLSKDAKAFFLSCHSPNLTPLALSNCLQQIGFKKVEMGSLELPNSNVSAGFYAGWRKQGHFGK
jgi:23S rRNA (cytosine1962-C5)-methyltransferase